MNALLKLLDDLTQLKPDSLFLLVGVILVTIGVVGAVRARYSDKFDGQINPGKWGRIASVVLGIAFAGTGIYLYNHFHAEPISEGPLTPQALNSAKQELPKFEPLLPHKALAVSDKGWAGISANRPTIEDAQHDAIDFCRGYAGKIDPCRVVMSDDKKQGDW